MQSLIISIIFTLSFISNFFIYEFLFDIKKISEDNIDKIVLFYNLIIDIILLHFSYSAGFYYLLIILFFTYMFYV